MFRYKIVGVPPQTQRGRTVVLTDFRDIATCCKNALEAEIPGYEYLLIENVLDPDFQRKVTEIGDDN